MSDKNMDISFCINPLDINLAKMQFNILKRYENEVLSVGNFSPLVEEYLSKDPTLDISLIKVICRYSTEKIRVLELLIDNKTQIRQECHILCEGTKEDIFSYLQKTDFVIDIKKFIFHNNKEKKKKFSSN